MSEHIKSNKSACYQHTIDNEGHKMDYDNIKVIDRASNDLKLRMKELLHIILNKKKILFSFLDILVLIMVTAFTETSTH